MDRLSPGHDESVSKLTNSYSGLNPEIKNRMIAGDIEIKLVPQGTLVEHIRAGGYSLGRVLTWADLGISVEECRQITEIDGEHRPDKSRGAPTLN